MKLDFNIRWLIANSDKELDPRLLYLLTKINQTGSLQAAAVDTNISYRTAWEIIRYWNNAFRTPLCIMERGRGTVLTSLGQALVRAKLEIETNLSDTLHTTANKLNNEIDELIGQPKQKKKLNAFASHDLAINFLQLRCEKSTQLDIQFQSRGSLDSLKLLNAYQADIIGFHFPVGTLANNLTSIYSQWLNDEKHILVQLAVREQGLILKPSLEEHIASLNDLTRRSVTFVNRQKGSGTRAIFDQLINLNDINKKDIAGYQKEEFTHTAVAAMISSGHADIGFGLKAAASQFKLSFLPLITENYIIAINRSLPKIVIKEIRLLLKERGLKNKINKLPGYNAKLTGKLIHVRKLLHWST